MKIDLQKIIEDNKKTKELEGEVEFKQELNDLICCIIRDAEEYYTNSDELIKRLGVKYRQQNKRNYFSYFSNNKYGIKLTKENIKKIQNYINKEEK